MATNFSKIKINIISENADYKLLRQNQKKERVKALKGYYGTVCTDFMENNDFQILEIVDE